MFRIEAVLISELFEANKLLLVEPMVVDDTVPANSSGESRIRLRSSELVVPQSLVVSNQVMSLSLAQCTEVVAFGSVSYRVLRSSWCPPPACCVS